MLRRSCWIFSHIKGCVWSFQPIFYWKSIYQRYPHFSPFFSSIPPVYSKWVKMFTLTKSYPHTLFTNNSYTPFRTGTLNSFPLMSCPFDVINAGLTWTCHVELHSRMYISVWKIPNRTKALKLTWWHLTNMSNGNDYTNTCESQIFKNVGQ